MDMTDPMDCRQVCTFLYAYLDNELESSTALLIEEHLSRCESCRSRFDHVSRVRDEIRHHVLHLEAPDRLKEGIRKVCRDGKWCVPAAVYVFAFAVVLILGTAATLRWVRTENPSVSAASTFSLPAMPQGEPVSLDGQIVCFRSMANRDQKDAAPISDTGNAYALVTDDGRCWVLLPSKRVNHLLNGKLPPVNRKAHVEGRIAVWDPQVVEVASLRF